MIIKTIKIFLILIASLFIFTSFFSQNAFAAVTVTSFRSDPTDWQVKLTYRDRNFNTRAGPVYMYMRSYLAGDYYANWNLSLTSQSGDNILWHTACIDPTDPVYNVEAEIDAGCHYGVVNAKYAGCYRLSSSTDYGSIGADAQCPYADNTDSYCTKAGNTAYPSICGNSYCGGTGGCTYYNKTCSDRTCTHPSTPYASACSSGGTDCAPPAPTVTGTPSCSAGAARISTSWGNVQYSNGVYDFRYRRSTTTTWTADADVTEPKVLSGLASNATYYVQVRGHTTSGHAGPTEWGTDTVVTGDCATPIPPPPTISSSTTCVSVGRANINLSWTPVSGATSYEVQYRYNGNTAWTNWVNNPVAGTSLTLSNTSATSYDAHVRANTPSGVTGYSNITSGTINCTVTSTPTPTPTPTPTVSPTPTPTSAPTLRSISGLVYVDSNANGTRDGGETGYSGSVTVTAGGRTSTGNYTIANNPNGTYTVTLTVPSGYSATTATSRSVTVSGANVTGIDFGIVSTSIFNPYGTHDTQTCTVASGWACDSDNFSQPLSIHFYDGPGFTNFVGQTTTGAFSRPDVTAAGFCGGNANVGFSFNMPSSIYDNGTHSIYAYAINIGRGNSNPLLWDSPRVITCTTSSMTLNVYQDLNGNGVRDTGENGYSGGRLVVTGQGAGTYTTNSSGQVVISNLPSGSSTISLSPVPSGYTATTATSRTISFPPSQTVNFGIQPAAPSCSGGLTASPVTVIPGQVSTLTANGCSTTAQGATLTYTWLTPTPGSFTSTNPSTTPTATWRAPSPYWTDTYAYPTVNVCQAGTSICRPYAISNGVGIGNQGIHIIPSFSVTGNVFVDQNKDSLQNGADTSYSGAISISPNPAGVTVTYPSPGNYVINNMPGGQYTISYTSLPAGYIMTYPQNGPPPSFIVTVGNASTGGSCSVSHNAASCDANGNIVALRYGISNSIPWIQSQGGDITGNDVTDSSGGGFTDEIPAGASCGPYASLNGSGGTPGVVYIGAGSADFGAGQASPNPYNWIAGGLTYPDTYIPSTPGLIRTSYAYMRSLATQSNLTPVNIATYCGSGGISNCTLSSSLPNGLYISNGNLTLTGASYTFPSNRNFVILVNGNLNINTEVHVPIGSTAFFTASGDINVASTVGEAVPTSTRSNVEGYYSTDRSFYALGLNSCPTTDRRLNVAGSIVVNASLAGGSFINQRDLCAGNLQCPAFMVIERPDFVLNSPEFLKSGRRVWREIAP